MRIAMLILAVLFSLSTIGASLMGPLNIDANLFGKEKNVSYDAKYQELMTKRDELKSMVSEDALETIPEYTEINDMIDSIPSPNMYLLMQAIYFFVIPLLALALLILAFMKKPSVKVVGPALIASAAVIWFLAPALKASSYGPASPKAVALGILVCAVLHALTSFLSVRFAKPKTLSETPST